MERAVLFGSEESHPYQLAREALQRSADGSNTHLPIQNPGCGPANITIVTIIYDGSYDIYSTIVALNGFVH